MRLQRLFLACIGVLAIAACSGQGGTTALPSGTGPSAPQPPGTSTSDPKVRAACGAPASKHLARCFALVRTDLYYKAPPTYVAKRAPMGSNLRAMSSSNFFSPLDPVHIRNAYNVPSGGSGAIVGIVDAYDDPNAEADLQVYRNQFSLPLCTTANHCFRKLNQAGHSSPLPPADSGWAEEISLDLDMVSATCPLCKITLVEGNSSAFADLAASEVTAKGAGAHQISNSYGGSEYEASDPSYNLAGVTITASSGDSSFNAGTQDPCALSTVVCVGGTSIYPYNNTRGWYENAWSGAGSGCSQFVAKPSWIPSGFNCNATNKRPESDISAVADPYTGVLVYDSYGLSPGFYVFGGTSVASPIIASIYAVSGHGSIDLNAKSIWTHPAGLTDVTTGNNGQAGLPNVVGQDCGSFTYICYAMPGYDGPTGNGTPYGLGAF